MSPAPDREPAPSRPPRGGHAADPHAGQSFWQRALHRFQSWHPTLRVTLVATLLWLLGAWHVIVAPIVPLTRLELALDDVRQSTALSPVAAPRDDASLRALGRWP